MEEKIKELENTLEKVLNNIVKYGRVWNTYMLLHDDEIVIKFASDEGFEEEEYRKAMKKIIEIFEEIFGKGNVEIEAIVYENNKEYRTFDKEKMVWVVTETEGNIDEYWFTIRIINNDEPNEKIKKLNKAITMLVLEFL